MWHDSGVQAAVASLVVAGIIGGCVGYWLRGLCDRRAVSRAAREAKERRNREALARMRAEYEHSQPWLRPAPSSMAEKVMTAHPLNRNRVWEVWRH